MHSLSLLSSHVHAYNGGKRSKLVHARRSRGEHGWGREVTTNQPGESKVTAILHSLPPAKSLLEGAPPGRRKEEAVPEVTAGREAGWCVWMTSGQDGAVKSPPRRAQRSQFCATEKSLLCQHPDRRRKANPPLGRVNPPPLQ